MFKNLTYEVSEGIATITFIREKALNALNNETVNELDQAISRIKEEKIRVLVFKGSGRAFISGTDINEFKGKTAAEIKTFSLILSRAVRNKRRG